MPVFKKGKLQSDDWISRHRLDIEYIATGKNVVRLFLYFSLVRPYKTLSF